MRYRIERLLTVLGMAAVVLFAGASCTRLPGGGSGEPSGGELQGTLSVHLEGVEEIPASKVTGVDYANESAITRWAYWVIDSRGIAAFASTGTGTGASVDIMSGTYRVLVIANYPTSGDNALPVSAGVTLASLQAKVAGLSDNAYNCLVFSGISESAEVTGGNTTPVGVTITRLVSKVGVKKISVAYTDPLLAAKTTKIKGIYVSNVYRTNRYGSDYLYSELSAIRSAWYNPMGWHADPSDATDSASDAILGNVSLDVTVTPSSPYTVEHYFYPMPNPSEPAYDTHDAVWCVRSSRLIVVTDLGGVTYYYQVQIPAMARNLCYIANEITITKRGSLDPELEIEGSVDVDFSISDSGWDTPVVTVSETL